MNNKEIDYSHKMKTIFGGKSDEDCAKIVAKKLGLDPNGFFLTKEQLEKYKISLSKIAAEFEYNLIKGV